MPGSFRFGTLFDLAARQQTIVDLEKRMGEPGFWDDKEYSRKIVTQLKAEKAIVTPLTAAVDRVEDLQTLLELATEESDDDAMGEVDQEAASLGSAVDRL